MPYCENYFWLQQLFMYGVICHFYNTGPVNNLSSFTNIHMSLQCKPYLSDFENHSSLVTDIPQAHFMRQVRSIPVSLLWSIGRPMNQCQWTLFPPTTLISFQVLPSAATFSPIILLQLFISLPLHVLGSSKNLAFLWQRNPS